MKFLSALQKTNPFSKNLPHCIIPLRLVTEMSYILQLHFLFLCIFWKFILLFDIDQFKYIFS
jgi:hypothetical protein